MYKRQELRRRGGDGGEYGATTGRPRRMGWLDLVAARYGCMVQGLSLIHISVDGKVAIVEGVDHLKAAPVRALDLRAGAAMVIAGLVAEGTTVLEDIQYIDRGYENIVEKLVDLGADIYRSQEPEQTMDKIG